ncbi:MAG: hypothetical protein JNJ45_09115 [Chthonomonas sp.]|nr:hypothetical protein [Chthonomonas sp.]
MLAAAVLVVSLLNPAQEVQLHRRAKIGDKATYALTMSFKSNGSDVKLTGTAREEVTRVEDRTIVTTRNLGDMVIEIGGRPQKIEDTSQVRIVQLDNGQIVDLIRDKRKSEDFRMANLSQIVVPYSGLAKGSKWKVDLNANAGTGLRTSILRFEVLELETVLGQSCAQVFLTGEELEGKNPIKSRGSVWISTKDGRLVKSSLTIDNAALGDGQAGVTVKSEQELKP